MRKSARTASRWAEFLGKYLDNASELFVQINAMNEILENKFKQDTDLAERIRIAGYNANTYSKALAKREHRKHRNLAQATNARISARAKS